MFGWWRRDGRTRLFAAQQKGELDVAVEADQPAEVVAVQVARQPRHAQQVLRRRRSDRHLVAADGRCRSDRFGRGGGGGGGGGRRPALPKVDVGVAHLDAGPVGAGTGAGRRRQRHAARADAARFQQIANLLRRPIRVDSISREGAERDLRILLGETQTVRFESRGRF